MYRAFTAQETRDIETSVMRRTGRDVAGLMRDVGEAVAAEAGRLAPSGRIAILAGAGNNAGDGWVAARRLLDAGRDVIVLAVSDPTELPEPAGSEAEESIRAGVEWRYATSHDDAAAALRGVALAVDALFGFGLRGSLREPYASVVRGLAATGVPVLSIDIPSGVEADTGAVHGEAVRADSTLAILARKVAHVQEPGRSHAGRVSVLDLDVESEALALSRGLEVWDAGDVGSVLPRPAATDHKGSRCRVVIAGGSRGMTGAAVLATWGALRTGAGYVVVCVPASLVDVVDAAVVPAVVKPVPELAGGALGAEALDVVVAESIDADALVVGPGLGRGSGATEFVAGVVARSARPLVLDADALTLLDPADPALAAREIPAILTPHPGEAARLLGTTSKEVQADRVAAARSIATAGAVCVLKGPGTVVAQGDRVAVVPTGGPALATLGTGDVLAGAVGSLLAQGLAPFDAAYAAAYLHGLAGERAGERLSDAGTTAIDVALTLQDVLSGVPASDR